MQVLLIAVTTLALVVLGILYFKRNTHTFPPGPRGVPLLGNIFDVPKQDEWRVYAEWSRLFGTYAPPKSHTTFLTATF